MVELLSTEVVETIVALDGHILVDRAYFEDLRSLANKRLAKTREKMERLRAALSL